MIPPGKVGHQAPSETTQRRTGGPHLPVQTPLLPSPGLADSPVVQIPPRESVPAPICVRLPHTRPRGEQRLCPHEHSGNRDHPPGVGVYPTRGLQPANNAVPPAMPGRPQHRHFCGCLRHHKPHPSSRGGSLGVEDARNRPSAPTAAHTGRHLSVIVDAVNDTNQQPRHHAHQVWVVVDAAIDFQIVRKMAWHPLHKATDSSLGTQALLLWAALRSLPKTVVLHLVKQESHRYSLGNGQMDLKLHAHNHLAERMLDREDPPLQDHMHTHLQHLPPIPQPREPAAWVPDDRIHNDTDRHTTSRNPTATWRTSEAAKPTTPS